MTPRTTNNSWGVQKSQQCVSDGRFKEVHQRDLTSGWIVSSFCLHSLWRHFLKSSAFGGCVRCVVLSVLARWHAITGSFAVFITKIDSGCARINRSRHRSFAHPRHRRRFASGIWYTSGWSFQRTGIGHGNSDAFIRTTTVDVDPVDVRLGSHLI